MKRFALCIACSVVTLGCGGETQKPEILLYEARSSARDIVPVQEGSFSNGVITGPEGKPIPLRIRWTAGRDTSNCLRIASVRVERNGGDPSVVVSDVKHAAVTCGMEFESTDTTRFETALIMLRYRTISGLKRYEFAGAVARITGAGDIAPVAPDR